jgi:hypothetical protein
MSWRRGRAGDAVSEIHVMVKLHRHAKRRCKERGATAAEVIETVTSGAAKPSKLNRTMFSRTFRFGNVAGDVLCQEED